ncbi:hypothetical protein [Halostagnicola kamekurae]|uniref:Uncharacterized protein n=1 Tax=Halostagnicola kamekurae TaxID=619731 RepID=A0A1I6RMG3_9EURY|nr:hypothetical protein [Halostagnicola kamekurae]SFS65899.1 hypothetical protein SAMN04488556_1909 [Halostagnicola kamekurae]
MEITITLDHGPLNAEFAGEDREEIEESLVGFVEFLEENGQLFDEVEFEAEPQIEEEQSGIDDWNQGSNDASSPPDESVASSAEDSPLSSIAQRVGTSIDELEELVYVSVEDDELPMVLVDDVERLGDSVVERQRNTALLLLLIWNKCYGKEKMKTSDIKNVFSMMDISTSNTYRAWEKSYFKQKGQGSSATIQLRGPGEREAYSLLRDLLEDDSE